MIHLIGCPKCKRQYKINGDPAGKQLKCPACNAVFISARSPAAGQPQEAPQATPAQPAKAGAVSPLGGSQKLFPDQPVPIQGADPLSNHVIQDPGFAPIDVEQVRRRRAEEAKKSNLDHAFRSSSALGAMADEQAEKEHRKRTDRLLSGYNLFEFDGRIPRKIFWLASLAVWAIEMLAFVGLFGFIAVILFALEVDPESAGLLVAIPIWVIFIVVAVLNTWIGLALQIKRLHDRNRSGLWILLTFIPIAGFFFALWLFIECGFLRGTVGKNQYGPDPLAKRR